MIIITLGMDMHALPIPSLGHLVGLALLTSLVVVSRLISPRSCALSGHKELSQCVTNFGRRSYSAYAFRECTFTHFLGILARS